MKNVFRIIGVIALLLLPIGVVITVLYGIASVIYVSITCGLEYGRKMAVYMWVLIKKQFCYVVKEAILKGNCYNIGKIIQEAFHEVYGEDEL